MLSNEQPGVVNKLETKARAQHAVEMDEWNMSLGDISLVEDVDKYVFAPQIPDLADSFSITRARDTLFNAVFPLLGAIGTYAGCYISLVAGNAVGDDHDEGFFTA